MALIINAMLLLFLMGACSSKMDEQREIPDADVNLTDFIPRSIDLREEQAERILNLVNGVTTEDVVADNRESEDDSDSDDDIIDSSFDSDFLDTSVSSTSSSYSKASFALGINFNRETQKLEEKSTPSLFQENEVIYFEDRIDEFKDLVLNYYNSAFDSKRKDYSIEILSRIIIIESLRGDFSKSIEIALRRSSENSTFNVLEEIFQAINILMKSEGRDDIRSISGESINCDIIRDLEENEDEENSEQMSPIIPNLLISFLINCNIDVKLLDYLLNKYLVEYQGSYRISEVWVHKTMKKEDGKVRPIVKKVSRAIFEDIGDYDLENITSLFKFCDKDRLFFAIDSSPLFSSYIKGILGDGDNLRTFVKSISNRDSSISILSFLCEKKLIELDFLVKLGRPFIKEFIISIFSNSESIDINRVLDNNIVRLRQSLKEIADDEYIYDLINSIFFSANSVRNRDERILSNRKLWKFVDSLVINRIIGDSFWKLLDSKYSTTEQQSRGITLEQMLLHTECGFFESIKSAFSSDHLISIIRKSKRPEFNGRKKDIIKKINGDSCSIS